MGNGIYFKIAGWIDLDMPHIFAIKVNLYHLPCNFEVNPITHFDRLWKLEKRGDEIKKKSSPLKLLNQSQPNFAEMILRWSPFKIVSVSTQSWLKLAQ
jgi:hypothetical protein